MDNQTPIDDNGKAAYVSMKNVGHKYDPRPETPMVVQDINLDIHRHEFVAVVGPSWLWQIHLITHGGGITHSVSWSGIRVQFARDRATR